jgi:hypothetical protein
VPVTKKIARRGKQIELKVRNKLGAGAKVFGALRAAKANVIANCCYEMEPQAHFWIVAKDTTKAKRALRKAGFKPATSPVLLVDLKHRPGALARVLDKLAAAKIDVRFAYASASAASALLVLMTVQDAKALKVLNA